MTSASAFPVPINAREREFFQIHTGEFDRGLYVGKPIRSISDGRWITPVSRRLIDSSGAFIGVVGGVYGRFRWNSGIRAALRGLQTPIIRQRARRITT